MKTFESMKPRVVVTTNASRVESPRPLVVVASSSRRPARVPARRRPRLVVATRTDASSTSSVARSSVGLVADADADEGSSSRWERAGTLATTDANERRRTRARVPTRDARRGRALTVHVYHTAREPTNERGSRA